jgi:hypothetical protein
MQAVSRPYALAAAVVAATSAVVAIPLASHSFQLPVRSLETRLINADIANIPVNLFDDIMNIPYNEINGGGLASVANSLLFTGTWWVPSSSNLWGIDPGDPTHVALIDNFFPLTAFTQGFVNSAGVYEPGLNYEFDGLLAAEIPVSSSCDASTCFPMTPPEVITGSTQFDRDIGLFHALTGQATTQDGSNFGLFDNWFKVPIQDLINGYTFQQGSEPNGDTGIINPSGPVYPNNGWGSSGNPFEGGTGAGNAMSWDGTTYHLNLLQPFQTLYDSLLQTPSTAGIGGTGVEIPTMADVNHVFENLLAGMIIDFDGYTAGSPACPALCDIPASMQVPALVQDIYNADPTNTTLATWLADYAAGTANEPTQDQINASIALLQTGLYNLTPTQLAEVDKALASINPELPALMTNAGWYTDPAYLAYTGTGPLEPVYGGYNPNLIASDLLALLTNNQTNYSELTNVNLLWFLADPLTGTPPAAATDAGTSAAAALATNALGSFDPSTVSAFSTDFSNLLTSMGLTAGSDLLSQLISELGTQLAADLGTTLPSSILSMF